jgi:hypothetical protein
MIDSLLAGEWRVTQVRSGNGDINPHERMRPVLSFGCWLLCFYIPQKAYLRATITTSQLSCYGSRTLRLDTWGVEGSSLGFPMWVSMTNAIVLLERNELLTVEAPHVTLWWLIYLVIHPRVSFEPQVANSPYRRPVKLSLDSILVWSIPNQFLSAEAAYKYRETRVYIHKKLP